MPPVDRLANKVTVTVHLIDAAHRAYRAIPIIRIIKCTVIPAIWTICGTSKVDGPKSGVLRDPREHVRPDLLAIVKRKHVIGPSLTFQGAV